MFNQLKLLKLWQKEDQTKVQGLLVLRNRVIANDEETICRGEVFTVEDAKAIYDKHVRNINREITYWDVYVAVNAQY